MCAGYQLVLPEEPIRVAGRLVAWAGDLSVSAWYINGDVVSSLDVPVPDRSHVHLTASETAFFKVKGLPWQVYGVRGSCNAFSTLLADHGATERHGRRLHRHERPGRTSYRRVLVCELHPARASDGC